MLTFWWLEYHMPHASIFWRLDYHKSLSLLLSIWELANQVSHVLTIIKLTFWWLEIRMSKVLTLWVLDYHMSTICLEYHLSRLLIFWGLDCQNYVLLIVGVSHIPCINPLGARLSCVSCINPLRARLSHAFYIILLMVRVSHALSINALWTSLNTAILTFCWLEYHLAHALTYSVRTN